MVDHLIVENRIPDYILEAVKYVLSDRDLQPILEKMLTYNLSMMTVGWEDENEKISSKPDFYSRMQEYGVHCKDSFYRLWEL